MAADKEIWKKGINTQFSGEKAVINGRKGGLAKGKSYAQKRTISEYLKEWANGEPTDKAKSALKQQGLDPDNITNGALIAVGLASRAVKGDIQAVDRVLELTESGGGADSAIVIPAKDVAASFSDINRQIAPNIEYVFTGGRGSTKSSYVSLKILELMSQYPGIHACVVRRWTNTLKDSVFASLRWAAIEMGVEDRYKFTTSPMTITDRKTGQVIYFRGADDPAKLKSIRPPFGYIGVLWFEEIDQMTGAEAVRNIEQSVLRGGDIAFTFKSFNPPQTASNWMNQYVTERKPSMVVHHSDYRTAPVEWLGQHFIDEAEHLKEINYHAYEHEYLGIANGTGGNVFENLEIREITDEEVKTFDKIYMGVDYGWFPDPFAFIRLHYDRAHEKIYFIDEIYANKLTNEVSGKMILDRKYTDAYIICDSAEPKSVADFRALGLPAKAATKGPGSVDYGMKWLQRRTIVIDRKRTPNAYSEFVNYEYERNKDDEIISGYPDENNHLIDAVRYALEPISKRMGVIA